MVFLAGDDHDLGSCRAGMMELERDPAKIRAKHPQGNNLFVRQERCRAADRESRAPLGSCFIPAGMEREPRSEDVEPGLSLPPARPLHSSAMAL